jgi:hypothetical protein
MAAPTVIGPIPTLIGSQLQELIFESFVAEDQVVAHINVAFIKAANLWYSLALDHGTLHWRGLQAPPQPWTVEAEHWNYPHRDAAEEIGLRGNWISDLKTSADGNTAQVSLSFSNGSTLRFFNCNDATHYEFLNG